MRTCAGFILAILCGISAAIASAEFPPFTTHVIDSVGKSLGQTALADMNNDGRIDYVVGEQSRGSGSVWWFEHQSPDKWIRHDIGRSNTDVGGDCHDVNGDGWTDYWGGTVLHLNNGDGTFARHEVGTVYSHDSIFADIDGDGRMDGVANRDARGLDAALRSTVGLFWYRIPEAPTQPWTPHLIASAEEHEIHGGIAPQGVGDLNGDGDADVATGQVWYENVDGKGTDWKAHQVLDLGERHQYGIAVRTWVGDLDVDRDNDIVQAEADNPDARVAWFENDGKGNFTRHIVKDKGEKQDFHSLVVADFNNDGRLDLYSGGGPLSTTPYKLYIWENLGNGQWREHVIATGIQCHEAVGGDVDGDGDIDIVTKHWNKGNSIYFLENRLIAK